MAMVTESPSPRGSKIGAFHRPVFARVELRSRESSSHGENHGKTRLQDFSEDQTCLCLCSPYFLHLDQSPRKKIQTDNTRSDHWWFSRTSSTCVDSVVSRMCRCRCQGTWQPIVVGPGTRCPVIPVIAVLHGTLLLAAGTESTHTPSVFLKSTMHKLWVLNFVTLCLWWRVPNYARTCQASKCVLLPLKRSDSMSMLCSEVARLLCGSRWSCFWSVLLCWCLVWYTLSPEPKPVRLDLMPKWFPCMEWPGLNICPQWF